MKTEPQAIETTDVIATLYFKSPSNNSYRFINSQQHFPKRKYIVHKSRTETKNRLDHEIILSE